METIRVLLYGVSSQRPSHSLYIGGEQLPLEARMGGIFLGFLWGLLFVILLGRSRAARLPARRAAAFCGGLLAVTALDGLNAFLVDGGLPHLYQPATAMRLLTGMGAGFAVAMLALPVIAGVIWMNPSDEEILLGLREAVAGLAVVLLLGALLLLDLGPLLWPSAVLMLLSVVVGFGTANLYLLAWGTGRVREATSLHDLGGLSVAALGAVLVELAAFAGMRLFLERVLGVVWGF